MAFHEGWLLPVSIAILDVNSSAVWALANDQAIILVVPVVAPLLARLIPIAARVSVSAISISITVVAIAVARAVAVSVLAVPRGDPLVVVPLMAGRNAILRAMVVPAAVCEYRGLWRNHKCRDEQQECPDGQQFPQHFQ